VKQDGVWRLRRTALDVDAFQRFLAAQEAAGRPTYPEMADDFQRPVGDILLEAPDLDAFCIALETSPWPPEL
jgi:hypothetical protein